MINPHTASSSSTAAAATDQHCTNESSSSFNSNLHHFNSALSTSLQSSSSSSIPITPYNSHHSTYGKNKKSINRLKHYNQNIKNYNSEDCQMNYKQPQHPNLDDDNNITSSVANNSENATMDGYHNYNPNQNHPPKHYFYGSDLVRNTDGTPLLDHNQKVVTVAKMLATKPLKHELATRPGPGGKKLTYISGDSVTRTLNDIFGFDGWCLEVKDRKREICEKDSTGRFIVAYTAKVRVTHRMSGAFKEDFGAGDATDKSLPTAVSNALKSSITDALKRAVRHFGDKLGNSLYESKFSINNAPRTLTEAFNQYEYDRANKKFGHKPISNTKQTIDNDLSSSLPSSAMPNSTSTTPKSQTNGMAATTKDSKTTTYDGNSMSTTHLNNNNNNNNNNNTVSKNLNLQHHQQSPPQQSSKGPMMSIPTLNSYQAKSNTNPIQRQEHQKTNYYNAENVLSSSNQNTTTVIQSSHIGSTSNLQTTATSTTPPGGISRFQQQSSSSSLHSSSKQNIPQLRMQHQQNHANNMYTQKQQQQQQHSNDTTTIISSSSSRLSGIGLNQNSSTNIQPSSLSIQRNNNNFGNGNGPLSTISMNTLERPSTARGSGGSGGGGIGVKNDGNFRNESINSINCKRLAKSSLQQNVAKKANVYGSTNNPYATKKV